MSDQFDEEEFFDAEEGSGSFDASSARTPMRRRSLERAHRARNSGAGSPVLEDTTSEKLSQRLPSEKNLLLENLDEASHERTSVHAVSESGSVDPNAEEYRFRIVNKDTGEVIDIREFAEATLDYSLFPTHQEIQERSIEASVESDDEESRSIGGRIRGLFARTSVARPAFEEGFVRVTANRKESPEFGRLKQGQTIREHTGPVWTMKFSHDGCFLASAGQDHVIRVWQTIAVQETVAPRTESGEFQLLHPVPYRLYSDHTSDVVDIAWSRTNFLLSASIDKTVRLWHVTRDDCLQFFKHADIVTSVDFHPLHDRYFVSACFDKKIRVWDVLPDGHVKEWAQAPEMVTSACFSPDGSMVVAGLFHGQVFFYTYDGMRYYTQIECRNRHGQHKQGRKVTGLAFAPVLNTPGADEQDQPARASRRTSSHHNSNRLLVTTNDSRIRMFQMDDYSMLCKYKGLRNDAMQIKATFSETGDHIICGSENGGVYVWNTVTPQAPSGIAQFGGKKDRNRSFETFDAASGSDGVSITTVAIFAPRSALQSACAAQRGAVVSASMAVLTADYAGHIKVFVRI